MDSAPDLLNQALALHRQGKLAETEIIYRSLLAAQPDNAVIPKLLGSLCFQQSKLAEGIAFMDKAIALRPDYADAYYDRALALAKLGNFHEAIAGYHNAITYKPDFADAYINLGNALQEINAYEKAVESYDKALALKGDFAQAYTNKGKALHEMKRFDEALACYEKAIALSPDVPKTYLNKAILKLQQGEFEEGWKYYEWRLKKNREDNVLLAGKPLWRGEPVMGKTLLLHAEQGLGDTIQCCRYVPMVEALGASVILKVPSELMKLMKTLKSHFRLISNEDPCDDFDMHCPFFSLPQAFQTRQDTIPAPVPYLSASLDKANEWKQRLGPKNKPRIGLVWSGSSTNSKDRNRTVPLQLLLPILSKKFEFDALQKDISSDDRDILKQNGIITHAEQLYDFADTAALVDGMDLVISIDTSVAHLAGALNKPLWLLLPYVPDFRWMLDRQDSPWYPSARLFRQTNIGDWNSVVSQLSATLLSWNAL